MAFIIPVFIAHEGCPHSCSFCNQHAISGSATPQITPAEVTETIATWLGWVRPEQGQAVQVAFYGGSFTGLALPRQRELLGAVRPFVEQGRVQQIRLSTRPDYVDRERLDLLHDHGVSVVELGVQSLDDRVLRLAGRGHSCEDVVRAISLLRDGGLSVGMQLMLGLPGQSFRSLRKTVAGTIHLQPDCVRIYPVLVVEGSGLAAAYGADRYHPLSLDKAVLQAAYMKKSFDQARIRVIRMGLQAGATLERSLIAGPYHPAFGELVLSRLMLRQTRRLLQGQKADHTTLVINRRDLSIFRGIRSANMHRLAELGLLDSFSLVTDDRQQRYQIRVHDQ